MPSYTYEVLTLEEGFLARCIEVAVEALADTHDRAVASLRSALCETSGSAESVVPPPDAPLALELVARVEPSGESSGSRRPLRSRASLRRG